MMYFGKIKRIIVVEFKLALIIKACDRIEIKIRLLASLIVGLFIVRLMLVLL
jgi:hypothetical protein